MCKTFSQGFPDNIRLSSNGKSFYVALFSSRSLKEPSFFDRYSQRTLIRKVLGEIVQFIPDTLTRHLLAATTSSYGIIVELDLDGQIVDSYHDSDGKFVKHISQVN